MSSPSDCEYCPCLIAPSYGSDVNLSAAVQHETFHGLCLRCTPRGTYESSLCAFCKHLRLYHLIFCASNLSTRRVDLGPWREVQKRGESGCVLCGIIDSVVKTHQAAVASSHGTLEPHLETLYADLYTHDSSLTWPAQAKLSSRDIHGKLTNVAGELHIYNNQRFQQQDLPFLGGSGFSVRPRLPWDRIKSILHRCELGHGECTSPSLGRFPPPGFRLIDVLARRLVSPTKECRFIALSYVWGKSPDASKLQTTLSNIAELEEEGGLARGRVSTTIEDAMAACARLGERFLWADRLCIVQDDAANKRQQIASMVDIYSRAATALVIAAGNGVDDSIPGVENPRQHTTKAVYFDEMCVRTAFPLFPDVVGNSVWASRGWTYQESALPKRKLFLTPVQFIFECEHGHVYEDSSLNFDPWKEVDMPAGEDYRRQTAAVFGQADPFVPYRQHAAEYNIRSLTNVSDVYNAFGGIARGLYGISSPIWYGLPERDFDQALLWDRHTYKNRGDLIQPAYRQSSGTIILPTWSWSSIHGNLEYPHNEFYGAIVQWAAVLENGSLKPLTDCANRAVRGPFWNDNENFQRAPQLVLGIAAAEGCLTTGPLPDLGFWRDVSFLDAANALAKRWLSYRAFYEETFAQTRRQSLTPTENLLRPGMMVTHAQVATFRVAKHPFHSLGNCETWLELRDATGSHVGMLAPDVFQSSPESGRVVTDVECIGLSISSLDSSKVPCLHPEYNTDPSTRSVDTVAKEILRRAGDLEMTYWDPNGTPLWPLPIVNVMMIERSEEFTRRSGIGWVLLTKWVRLERIARDIVIV